LDAASLSFDSIGLSWTDNSSNETGFRIERRIVDGSFELAGTTGANSGSAASFTDTGLDGSTAYEYQVIAFNGIGDSLPSNIHNATTDAAPDIQLSATGRKVKGRHTVDLSWETESTTDKDVYEGGNKIAGPISEPVFKHSTGQKGSGSYTYQVCEAGTSACSNMVTVVF